VNIGNPKEFAILELAEKIIELTSSKSRIVYKPGIEDDPRQRQPSIDLARKQLGWEPRVELGDGLRKTIEYFKAII